MRLAMLFKIVKCNMPVEADAVLLPAYSVSGKFQIQAHPVTYCSV